MKLVYGHDEAIAAWVAKRIPYMQGLAFQNFVALGVADGNTPVAGIVFSEHYPSFKTMQLSMAADSPRWAQRGIIKGVLNYPFEQQGVNKLWTGTPATNKRAIRFNEGVGFTREAILAHHFGEGVHGVICRMLFKDYTKIYKKEEGHARRAAA